MIPAVYREIRRVGRTSPAVFLDRDGVLVEDTGHLHRVADIRYIEGALEAVTTLNAAGLPVVLVTNQAGIGRGLYGWDDFQLVQQQIDSDLAACGGRFDGVWACAAYPRHLFRKPNTGMLHDAAERMSLDLGRSWLVGDQPSDIEAGLRAQLAAICHVATGHGARNRAAVEFLINSYGYRSKFYPCSSLRQAVPRILECMPAQHSNVSIRPD